MSKAFGSPRCPNWLRSGLNRPQEDTIMEKSDSDGASKSPELEAVGLGPEALKMKKMAEAMNLSNFETAQLIAQGAKTDREVELKSIEIRENIKTREANAALEEARVEREQERWNRFLDRENSERLAFRESFEEMRQPRNPVTESFRVKIPPFNEKDDIDEYLSHFQLIASANGWSRDFWAVRLIPLLQGTARDAVKNLTEGEIHDYDTVKKALLFRFRKTSEHFRNRFRRYKRKEGETFAQAGEKMKECARKWMLMKGKNPDNLNDVWDCLMQEAAYDLLGGGDLEIKVRESEPDSYKELLETADVIAEAKRTSQRPRQTQGEYYNDEIQSPQSQSAKLGFIGTRRM